MEQLVARWAHNPKVAGSNPVPATIKAWKNQAFFLRGRNMYTVYVLFSPTYDKIYIGFTSDIKQRLLSHNELSKKGWTVNYRPWELVYSEKFSTKKETRKREKQLKSGKGREFIWKMIKER